MAKESTDSTLGMCVVCETRRNAHTVPMIMHKKRKAIFDRAIKPTLKKTTAESKRIIQISAGNRGTCHHWSAAATARNVRKSAIVYQDFGIPIKGWTVARACLERHPEDGSIRLRPQNHFLRRLA